VPHRFFTAHSPEEPPSQVPLILGDFIHNLRASLDYAIGEMLPRGATKKSAFPITNKGRKAFDEAAGRNLVGIPDPALEIIERMQPYRRGRPSPGRRNWNNLEILELLWNIDKHRSILLAVTVLSPEDARHNRSGEEPTGIGWAFAPADKQAQWAIALDGRDETFDPHFGVQVSLTKPRGFAKDWIPLLERWPLESLVTNLYTVVQQGVLPQLRQFMKPGN